MRKNIVVFFSFSRLELLETNVWAGPPTSCWAGLFHCGVSVHQTAGWPEALPQSEETPCSWTQVHTIDSHCSELPAEGRAASAPDIYEDSALLCKMVTCVKTHFNCVSVWLSMCVTGRLAEGRVGLTRRKKLPHQRMTKTDHCDDVTKTFNN